MGTNSPDDDMREHLEPYLNRVLTAECKDHITDVYLFGSYAVGQATRESDVDVFLVVEPYEYPSHGDRTMAELAHVPEAIQSGHGRRPGDRWSGTDRWGVGPEEATEALPGYLVKSLRNVIATRFNTDVSARYVDVFFGSRAHLESYASSYERLEYSFTSY